MIPVSLLSSYLYCPRKIYLQRVLRLEEPTRESTLRGTIKHNVYDEFSFQKRNIIVNITPDNNLEDIRKAFETLFKQILRNQVIIHKKNIQRLRSEPAKFYASILPTFSNDIKSRAKTVWDFIIKHKVFGEKLWERLTPKIKSEYYIESEILGLKGKIDQVHVYDGKVIPFELKTGKTAKEGLWPGHKIQLAAYIMLLEEKFDMDIGKGEVYYIDENEIRELELNNFHRDDVVQTRENLKALLDSKEIPPIINNENKCNSCAFKKDCYDEELMQKKLKAVFS